MRPPQNGRVLWLQRRGSGGSYRTVARTGLPEAGEARSTYSRRLRVFRDGVYFARVLGGGHLAGTSRRRRIDLY